MQPIIGITSSMGTDEKYYFVSPDNIQAITKSGGLPIILPYLSDYLQINALATKLDGLYLTGGGDIDPIWFGEQPHRKLGEIVPARDYFEIILIRRMVELGKPILAVCRGCQILNIALGGDMYQDIYSQIDHELIQHEQKAPQHHQSHHIKITTDSLLYELIGKSRLRVNSRHHQANKKVVEPLRVSAQAEDGIIEAIEGNGERFMLGLQWHPENLVAADDSDSLNIYKGFINACIAEKSEN